MAEKVCPECGCQINGESTCPECGYPIGDISIRANEASSEFNESKPYSPISGNAWIFKTPFPLNRYPRGIFASKHPFWGWLFGPFHIADNGNPAEIEYYNVINNIFLLWNVVAKSAWYSFFWFILKGWWIILISVTSIVYLIDEYFDFIYILLVVLLSLIIISCILVSATLASYHRYTPILIKTYRRIRKRHWISMYKAVKNNNLNLD